MLDQFLDQLNKELGVDGLPPSDPSGGFTLSFDPDIHITLRENAEYGISLFTTLVPLPEERQEELLLFMMAANLFGRETGGSALGLDKEGKRVTLQTFLPTGLTYKAFHDHLEDFVNYADIWKEEILAYIEQPVE